MQATDSTHKKPPAQVIVAPDAKLLVSRGEAAQLLSISERGLDHLIANRRLPTRRSGGRVLIPIAELQVRSRRSSRTHRRMNSTAMIIVNLPNLYNREGLLLRRHDLDC